MTKKTIDDYEWRKYTPYHWQTDFNGGKLDYWPTRDKWMYNGVVTVGGLLTFLEKGGGIQEPIKRKPATQQDLDQWEQDLNDALREYERTGKESYLNLINHLQEKIEKRQI